MTDEEKKELFISLRNCIHSYSCLCRDSLEYVSYGDNYL